MGMPETELLKGKSKIVEEENKILLTKLPIPNLCNLFNLVLYSSCKYSPSVLVRETTRNPICRVELFTDRLIMWHQVSIAS